MCTACRGKLTFAKNNDPWAKRRDRHSKRLKRYDFDVRQGREQICVTNWSLGVAYHVLRMYIGEFWPLAIFVWFMSVHSLSFFLLNGRPVAAGVVLRWLSEGMWTFLGALIGQLRARGYG